MVLAEVREYRAVLRASRSSRRENRARLKRRKLHALLCLGAQVFVESFTLR